MRCEFWVESSRFSANSWGGNGRGKLVYGCIRFFRGNSRSSARVPYDPIKRLYNQAEAKRSLMNQLTRLKQPGWKRSDSLVKPA